MQDRFFFIFFFNQQYLRICDYEADFCSREMILTTKTRAGESTGKSRISAQTSRVQKREAARKTDRVASSPNAASGAEPAAPEGSNRYSGAGGGSPGMWGRERVPSPPDPRYRRKEGCRPQARRPAPPPRRGPPGPAGKPGGKFANHSGAAREAPAAGGGEGGGADALHWKGSRRLSSPVLTGREQ